MKRLRMKSDVLLVLITVLCIGLFYALPAGAEVPITANAADEDSSDVLLDPYGTLHAVYVRAGTIYYLIKSDGIWSTEETVAVGSSPAIAVDFNGVPHVAFLSGGVVMYTNKSGGAWMETPETVAGSGSVNYLDMDVDGDGKVHIVYSDPWYDGDSYNELLYTNNTTGSFGGPTLFANGGFDSGRGDYFSSPNIRVDGAGNYHISYIYHYWDNYPGSPDYDFIQYFDSLGTSLQGPTAFGYNSAVNAKNGITLDGSGNVHLVYSSGGSIYHGNISGGVWTETPGIATGSQASVSVDLTSTIYVAYINGSGYIAYVADSGTGFSSPVSLSSSTSGRNPTVAAGSTNAHVIFEAHDGVDYEIYEAITGPAISADPRSFEFGSVNVGSSTSPQTFTIHSVGTEDLSITDISLSDTTNFTLDASGCGTLPTTLSPGNNCTVTVTFNPTTSGLLDAALSIYSNAPSNPQVNVYVTGTGAEFTLSVSKSGTGSGTVSSSPEGIDCGEDCEEGYDPDTEVTLTPAADTGSHFTGWTGCDSVVDDQCIVTMTADKSVTAEFTLDTHTLSVVLSGTGSPYGSVTSSPAGIDCGSDCSEVYDYGTVVTLTPDGSAGATFAGWTGCGFAGTMDVGPPSNQCVVTITEDMEITAEFTINTYTVSVEKTGTGSGTVTSSPAGIDCGDDCSEVYDYATVVTLTATVDPGSSFDGWEGCDSVNGNECTITVSGDATARATFSHIPADVFVCPSGCDFDTLQAAIDASGPGDTIKVAQGTYHENIAITEAKQFTLQGGWDSTFSVFISDASLTIIDGDVNDDGSGDGSVFDITGNVTLTIENLTLRNGNSDFGGGIHFVAPVTGSSQVTLLNSIIRDNYATYGGGIYATSPGMMSVMTLTAINNLFLKNQALINGGGIYVGTGGPMCSSNVSLTNNTITTNAADSGGGLFVTSSPGTSTTVNATHNILWGNEATTYGPDIYLTNPATTVYMYYSDIGVVENDGDNPAAYTETNNISADPIFINPALANYHIHGDSPCRDAGAPVVSEAPTVEGGGGLPSDDFEGDDRPQGSAYDIGADEYAEITVTKVKLLSCNGKEILPSGGNYHITWMARPSMVKFNLFYSLDGGLTWTSIAKDVTDRHYLWTLPTPKKNKKALVKVKGFSAKSVLVGSDISDAPFTIEVVKILGPNGGETLYPPGSATITWQTNVTAAEVGTVKLSYTLNGGLTWNLIETLTVNEGTYDWPLPTVKADKTKCKVKVVLKDEGGAILGSDVSDGFFTMKYSLPD